MRTVPWVVLLVMLLSPCAAGGAVDSATVARAEQGDLASQWALGIGYLEGRGVTQDMAKAEHWLRKAAEQGSAKAQYRLARLYDKGQGVTQDLPGAAAWYRKAADQGLAVAQNNLGNFYRDGRGVEQNHEAAVTWYRKAASQGDGSAQVNLGLMYDSGLGVAQDKDQALFWYRKSAQQGNPKAQMKLRAPSATTADASPATQPATAPTTTEGASSTQTATEGSATSTPLPATTAAPRAVPEPRAARVKGARAAKKAQRSAAARHKKQTVRPARRSGSSRRGIQESVATTVGMPEGVGRGGEGSRPESNPGRREVSAGNATGHLGWSPGESQGSAEGQGGWSSWSERPPAEQPVARETAVLHFQRMDTGDAPGVVRGGAVERELADPVHAAPVQTAAQVPVRQEMSRYVDQRNGTIADYERGLVGLKNANCFGRLQWPDAHAAVQDLAEGRCQLSDGSRSGDWRLPTLVEMQILLDWQESGLFVGAIQSGYYWSATQHDANPGHMWYLAPAKGMLYNGSPERRNFVWPVRTLRSPQ
ncbi:MAG: DUF1566 domain-containing protein [Magnetococcus sp. MYC-9]